MAKARIEDVAEDQQMSKEEKIQSLKEQIKTLKEKGSFKHACYSVRKGTVEIMKNESLTEEQKKETLLELFDLVSAQMEE